MVGATNDERDVLATNQAYYDAFEARNLAAMSQLWEHSDRVCCTHPGWTTLRGWAEVAASYFALFQGDGTLQFVLTQPRVGVQGDVGWVNIDENLLGNQGGATIATTNLFVRTDQGWRLLNHHGSPVHAPPPAWAGRGDQG